MSEYTRRIWANGEEITDEKLNNIENGIVEAKREAASATAKAQNAAKGVIQIEQAVTIPAIGWEVDEAIGCLKLAVRNCAVTAKHVVDINLNLPSLEVAAECGWKNAVQSYDGGVYVYAEEVPDSAMAGTMVIMSAEAGTGDDDNDDVVPFNALAGADGVYLTVQEE